MNAHDWNPEQPYEGMTTCFIRKCRICGVTQIRNYQYTAHWAYLPFTKETKCLTQNGDQSDETIS